jgi:hypothetical protein
MSGENTRRAVLALMGAAGLAAAGGIAYEAGLFAPGYPQTPYGDLLAKLPDRTVAARVGKAMLAEQPDFDAKTAATNLRKRLRDRPLSYALVSDIDANNLAEVHGWVMPETLVQLSALAATKPPSP